MVPDQGWHFGLVALVQLQPLLVRWVEEDATTSFNGSSARAYAREYCVSIWRVKLEI